MEFGRGNRDKCFVCFSFSNLQYCSAGHFLNIYPVLCVLAMKSKEDYHPYTSSLVVWHFLRPKLMILSA